MKKVAIIVNSLKKILSGGAISGGGGVVISNLIDNFSKLPNVKLTIICQDLENITLDNVEIINQQTENASNEFFDKINDILQKRDFDIVLSGLVDFCGKNSLLQAHSHKHRLDNSLFFIKPFKKIFSRKKIKAQNKLFDCANKHTKFIVVSNNVKHDYQNNFRIPSENIIVAYPGAKQISETFQPFSKKENIDLGIVAGRSMNKGFVLLLFALFFVKLAGNNFNLNILTKKIKLKYLINFLGLKKQVNIIEECEMDEFYQNIDCLILPSFSEAFGLVVIEAMTFGKPCLVSSNAGSAEIITKENGFVFNRKSFWSLVKKLIKIINLYEKDFNKYLEISSSAFETSKNYTWEKFTTKIFDELKND